MTAVEFCASKLTRVLPYQLTDEVDSHDSYGTRRQWAFSYHSFWGLRRGGRDDDDTFYLHHYKVMMTMKKMARYAVDDSD